MGSILIASFNIRQNHPEDCPCKTRFSLRDPLQSAKITKKSLNNLPIITSFEHVARERNPFFLKRTAYK